MNLYPEFFNDVFGPCHHIGSASHTGAPCLAGLLANSLLGEPVRDILIQRDPESSFVHYNGMWNSELAMLNGAAGRKTDCSGFLEIEAWLKAQGIAYRVEEAELGRESTHTNAMKFILTGASDRQISLVVNSIGGGLIETAVVNGYPFVGRGDTYVLFLFDAQKALDLEALGREIEARQEVVESGLSAGPDGGQALWVKLSEQPDPAVLELVSGREHALMAPIFPVITRKDRQPQLFTTMAEWRQLCAESGKPLSEIAIEYEMAASGWTRDEVIAYMRDYVARDMRRRVFAPLEEDLSPITDPYADLSYLPWLGHRDKQRLLSGAIYKSTLYGLCTKPAYPDVLHVPGPMSAGGGILYGVLTAVCEELGLGEEDLLRGLFVAGGVGAICCSRTATNGSLRGCAGECGVCGAMAAAAIVEMMGGTPEQAETAASLFTQTTIGWPCDRIMGAKGMPCTVRVMMTSVMSMVFAEYALAGGEAILPFHEVVDVLDQVGRDMDPSYRSTKTGALCSAPTARQCKADYLAWRDGCTQCGQ